MVSADVHDNRHHTQDLRRLLMFRKSQERPREPTDPKTTIMARRFHLRKPKSLESVSSRDSASTASMPRTPVSPTSTHHRHSRVVEFDPLNLHPTFQAPPRLSDRPFIHVMEHDEPQYHQPQPRRVAPKFRELELPPVASPRTSQVVEAEEVPDYFAMKLGMLQRPTLVRSHWSESTINTVLSSSDEEETDEAEEATIDDEDSEAEEQVTTPTGPAMPLQLQFETEREVVPTSTQWQNFSYKRNTVHATRRPPPGGSDNSIDNYVKRGGWKRRGIVFQANDSSDCMIDRLSAQTVG
ncbi:unnamed protein product [Parascedosporium putredinis]|uniref:Uncharacterized protein n=1 Tax=Parascedosporium putredinis TaxID=1442378 RepID=A0A9P1GWD5_9PEZI|nr:unnamed protein product [Parascedosporium putredinis]CAI7988283.1 unnamed protein product [Parascedosporium putredinis]